MQTRIRDDALYIWQKGKDDTQIFKDVAEKLSKLKAKLIERLVDVDSTPAYVYTLDGVKFSLVYDIFVDTYIYCRSKPELLTTIEQIILN